MKSLVAIVLLVGLKFLATQCSETDEKVVVTNKDEAAKETVKIDMSSMEQEKVAIPRKTEEVVIQNIKETTIDEMTHKMEEDNTNEASKETVKMGMSSMEQEKVQVPKKTEEVVVENIDTTTDGGSKIAAEPKEDIIDRLEKVNDNESKHVVMLHNLGTRSHLQVI